MPAPSTFNEPPNPIKLATAKGYRFVVSYQDTWPWRELMIGCVAVSVGFIVAGWAIAPVTVAGIGLLHIVIQGCILGVLATYGMTVHRTHWTIHELHEPADEAAVAADLAPMLAALRSHFPNRIPILTTHGSHQLLGTLEPVWFGLYSRRTYFAAAFNERRLNVECYVREHRPPMRIRWRRPRSTPEALSMGRRQISSPSDPGNSPGRPGTVAVFAHATL